LLFLLGLQTEDLDVIGSQIALPWLI
jgi:hypothetical protein